METHFCRSDSVGSNSGRTFSHRGHRDTEEKKTDGQGLTNRTEAIAKFFRRRSLQNPSRLAFVFPLCLCVVRENLRAVAVALHYAQECAPGPNRFAVLVGHDAG